MENSKYNTWRIAIIFLAIVSVVLAAIHIVGLAGDSSEGDDVQTDLSGYGDTSSTSNSDGLIYEDDGTVEMDSIPNDAMTSGSDTSGSDVSTGDASGSDAQ